MKKKLDTRFPAARIKKIMQADEDVGKIAMAVPVLVSKALELFLQDLCDRTYDITVQRGAKTVNSLHLKHCVHSYNVFDFLKEVVSKVPDYGHSDTAADVSKRRKVVANESNDSDEESKRIVMQETSNASSSGRGKGRGRGRGRGRPRAAERELIPPREIAEVIGSATTHQAVTQVPSPDRPLETNNNNNSSELKEENKLIIDAAVGGSYLNSGSDEKHPEKTVSTDVVDAVFADEEANVKGDDNAPLALSEMDRMAIDPIHVAQLGSRLDEDEEDYDEEG